MSRFALLLVVLTAAPAAWTLEAGAGVADITPDVKAFRVPLAGYGVRLGRPATGVHDPLRAKVLVLKDKTAQAALITCDLRSITPELKQVIVDKLAPLGFSLDNVFMAASHTHDGPAIYPQRFWQMQFGIPDPKVATIMADAIANAVRDTVKKLTPAKVGTAEQSVDGFARNRRAKEDVDAPLVASRLWVMRIDAVDGNKPLAILVNFAAHPTILGADNLLVSAEWPGVFQDELEKAFPGATAMFTNGAEGDQAPAGATGADDFAKAWDYGARMARLAVPLVENVTLRENASIVIARATLKLPPLAFPESAKKFGRMRDAAEEALPKETDIQILRVAEAALVGLPGEPLQVVGAMAEKALADAGIPRAVTVGLANDYIGYIVDEREYARGGYEVESRSFYGPDLGAFLAAEVAALAKKM